MYGKYAWYLYPRKWSLKGVYGSHHAVGWLVGWSVGWSVSKWSLGSKVRLQLLADCSETWYTWTAPGVDVPLHISCVAQFPGCRVMCPWTCSWHYYLYAEVSVFFTDKCGVSVYLCWMVGQRASKVELLLGIYVSVWSFNLGKMWWLVARLHGAVYKIIKRITILWKTISAMKIFNWYLLAINYVKLCQVLISHTCVACIKRLTWITSSLSVYLSICQSQFNSIGKFKQVIHVPWNIHVLSYFYSRTDGS